MYLIQETALPVSKAAQHNHLPLVAPVVSNGFAFMLQVAFSHKQFRLGNNITTDRNSKSRSSRCYLISDIVVKSTQAMLSIARVGDSVGPCT